MTHPGFHTSKNAQTFNYFGTFMTPISNIPAKSSSGIAVTQKQDHGFPSHEIS
jgi:hypothetical protein